MVRLMKIIEGLAQGTTEWHKFRSRHIMASDVSSIMGVNPWTSAYQVWLDKIGMGKPKEITPAMQHGIDCEPIARQLLNDKLGVKFEPKVAESSEIPYIGASLDGYYHKWDELHPGQREYIRKHIWICELKAMGLKGHDTTKQGFIPDHYLYQVQTQLLVTKADLCFFSNYYDGELAIIEVRPDAEIQRRIIIECKAFWDKNVLGYEAPPLGKGDYLERNDNEFDLWSRRWKENQLNKAMVEQQEKELRQEGLVLANNQNIRGFGLEISHTPRKGTIDYKHKDVVAALSNLDMENYRKPTTMVSTIRVKK